MVGKLRWRRFSMEEEIRDSLKIGSRCRLSALGSKRCRKLKSRTGLTLAERLCRTADWIEPERVFGPHHCLGRGTSAPGSEILRSLLQRRQNASVSKQGCAGLSAGSAIRCHKFTRPFGRTSSPLRSGLSFRYTQLDIPSARSRYDLLFPLAVERCKILIRKLDARGRNIFLKVLHLRRTWNRQHHGAALEIPCKRDLTRRGAVALRDLVQQRSRSG